MLVDENTRIEGVIELRSAPAGAARATGSPAADAPGANAEDLVVRGRVEGRVVAAGTVTVEAGGWIVASVEAREVIVRGTLRGDVRASAGIEVARTGRMLGDATAPRVSIAAGAAFRGRLELGDPEAAAPVEVEPTPPAPTPSAFAPPPSSPVAPAPSPPETPRATTSVPPLARPRTTLQEEPVSPPDRAFESRRRRLLDLLRERSYEQREVILASGRPSNFYIDCKQTVLTAEGHFLVGWLVCQVVAERAPQVRAVGGLTMGADPIASAASTVSFLGRGPALDAFYVRKEPKAHGTQKWLEGEKAVPPGTKVAVVEDVVTTGASTRKAIERARLHGLEVELVVALVDREEGGREEVEKDAPLVALTRKSEF